MKRKHNKSKSRRAAEANHESFLKSIGAHPSQRKSRKKEVLRTEPVISTVAHIPSVDSFTGTTTKKTEMQYSGERQLLGIAVMHKSNLVPVFGDRKSDVEDIAKMRRN